MTKSTMSKVRRECIAGACEHLKSMRRGYIRELAADARSELSESTGDAKDSADLAADEYERHVSRTLYDRVMSRIAEVDNALKRIDEASYGVCETCGLEIAELRLKALPFTRNCWDCQRDHERIARTRQSGRDFEQERVADFVSVSAGDEVGQEPMRRTGNG